MNPDPSLLLEKTGITNRLVGLYDALETKPFEPLVNPRQCIFSSYRDWMEGKSIFVTFFVNPDQLSALMTGAQYHSSPEDVEPVIAPFGSGCSMLVSLFKDLDKPQALVGSTDIAMRRHLPRNILSLTVTRPMYERLCRLDETG